MPGPAGIRMTDGFSTTISFSNNPTLGLWEVEPKPPGLDSGGPNDTTTMRNIRWRTMQPKHLITATPMTIRCQYDEGSFSALVSMLGQNQQITITFPTGRPLTIWGWLDKFEPEPLKEGSPPEATATIQPSNQDNTGAEVAPQLGTTTSTTTTTTTT